MKTALIVSILATLMAAMVMSVGASEPDQFSYRAYRKDLFWRNYYCRDGRYHPEGCDTWRWRRRHHARHAQSANNDGVVCHGVIPATGDQAQSENAAFENAIISWQGRVRFRYGERYIDFKKNARDTRRECAPSSIADALRDKTNPQLYRCEISGRPCRVPSRAINGRDD